MAWTSLSYAYGSVLTSAKMTQSYDNFAALAAGDSGAPTIQFAAIDSNIVPLHLLYEATISAAASADITSAVDWTTYERYKFVLTGLRPATSTTQLWMRYSLDGSTFVSSANYSQDGVNGDTKWMILGSLSNDAQNAGSVEVIVNRPGSAVFGKTLTYAYQNSDGATPPSIIGGDGYGGFWSGSGSDELKGFRFLISSGNITSAILKIYGEGLL